MTFGAAVSHCFWIRMCVLPSQAPALLSDGDQFGDPAQTFGSQGIAVKAPE